MEMDRETMYNGWAKSKVFLYATKIIREDSCTVEAWYEGRQYRYTAYKEDMIGTANMCNIAFNRVWDALREVNKNIELRYENE